MKEILVLYSTYNRDTNGKIIEILSRLSDEELKCERNMHYKYINTLFNHIVMGQWHYIKASMHILERNLSEVFQDRKKTFERIESSFKEAAEVLIELNSELIRFVNEVSEDELKIEKKKMKIYNGRVVDISVWQYMTQHIIHQTHHQGQLSQILDEMKIEHEFGLVFPYVLDSKYNE